MSTPRLRFAILAAFGMFSLFQAPSVVFASTCEGACVPASLCPSTAPVIGKGTCDPVGGATPLCCVSGASSVSGGSICAATYGGQCLVISGTCDYGQCLEAVKPSGSEVLCTEGVCCRKMTGDKLKKCLADNAGSCGASTSCCTKAEEGKTAQKKLGDLGSYDCNVECKNFAQKYVDPLVSGSDCLSACAKRYAQVVTATCVNGKWTDLGSSMTISNPLGGNADIPTVIGRIISTFLGLVGAISLVVFVFAGVRYLTAGGNEAAVTQAKDAMKYAFIGITIILFAYVITNFFFQALLKSQ